MMTYSAAMPAAVHTEACGHLIREDGQEDLCFALWYPSQGSNRTTALVRQLILPKDDERFIHGNAAFSAVYFERALGAALAANAGLAFMHSHPGPGWQGMSTDDIDAELGHAASAKGATGLPFVGLTLGNDDSWSARFWTKTKPRMYERTWCQSVRVVGRQLGITYNDALSPKPRFRKELTRTMTAWGLPIQEKLARLHIGVVGTGSVGSIVAEALARMGIEHIRLIDFDSIELINLDRLLHATRHDAKLGRSKVQVLARALEDSATAERFTVDALEWSIVEEEGLRAALDCDVIFSCVDRNWPRSVLNLVAYAHLIPVIDGGVRIERNRSGVGVRHADFRAHVAGPEHRCLECLKQYDPGLVAAEREGYADDPAYIEGLPANHSFKANQNVFAFGLGGASFEMMQFLSMIVSPSGSARPGAQMYHFIPGILDVDRNGCNPNCPFTSIIALGDRSGVTITGRHTKAEEMRRLRNRRWLALVLVLRQWAKRLQPFRHN